MSIKQVSKNILERKSVLPKTRIKYNKKFLILIQGCNDSNYVARCNDTDYIKNIYLAKKKARTIESYIGEIMAIHHSSPLLTEETIKILKDYIISTRDDEKNKKYQEEQNQIIEKKNITFNNEDSDDITIEDDEDSDEDYGQFCKTEIECQTNNYEIDIMILIDKKIEELNNEIKQLILTKEIIIKLRS